MTENAPGPARPGAADEAGHPENFPWLAAEEEVVARYDAPYRRHATVHYIDNPGGDVDHHDACGGDHPARRLMPAPSTFLLGRAATTLTATDQRLVLGYGASDSTTLHYGPGTSVSLFRAYPKLPVLSLLKRVALVLISLILLSGGPVYTFLGVLLLAMVLQCFIADWALSTLELVTPATSYGGIYRTTRVDVLTGFRRAWLQEFVERMNHAIAEAEAGALSPHLRPEPRSSYPVLMKDGEEPNPN